MNKEKRIVNCPTCKKESPFSPENPYRPFCSKRCHLLDLGAWADENYKISSTETNLETVNENSESKNQIH